MVLEKDYRKFSDRVCNLREAGFIGIGFLIAAVAVGAIIIGIYFGTACGDDEFACRDGYTCRPLTERCDGKWDCPIGDDEWPCHPREFYVSFRTATPAQSIPGLRPPSNGTVPAVDDTNLQEQMTRQIKEALENFPDRPLNETNPVDVFRFRSVNSDGVHLPPLDADQSIDSLFVAVDALVTFKDLIWINVTAEGNVASNPVSPAQIKEALEARAAWFAPLGTNVTTGVGVVLYGPESCTRPRVYCDRDCPKGYIYGSTKGCPEYPCACV